MPVRRKSSPSRRKSPRRPPARSQPPWNVRTVIAWLKRNGDPAYRDNLGPRFGITVDDAFGVSVADLRKLARSIGRDHGLALALWDSGSYDARMLAPFIADPARVTTAQMGAWGRSFDNWAVCDAACFHLFDRTPHALRMIRTWSSRKGEFERRGAFALLASLALHDKTSGEAPFRKCLSLIERAAPDGRNFVKKAV